MDAKKHWDLLADYFTERRDVARQCLWPELKTLQKGKADRYYVEKLLNLRQEFLKLGYRPYPDYVFYVIK